WVPTLLRRIDIAQGTFKRNEPLLGELPMLASDYLRRQVRFTPFPTEPVDWLIEQAGDELFLFSSDFPHPEGTKDPLGRFEGSVDLCVRSDTHPPATDGAIRAEVRA